MSDADVPAYWDTQGFYTMPVPDGAAETERQEQLDRDRWCAGYSMDGGLVHLRFRLRMEEPEMGRGRVPTGRTKVTWAPRLRVHLAPADPWDACRDVDPFTGQPDQHPCGDACENEGCSG